MKINGDFGSSLNSKQVWPPKSASKERIIIIPEWLEEQRKVIAINTKLLKQLSNTTKQ